MATLYGEACGNRSSERRTTTCISKTVSWSADARRGRFCVLNVRERRARGSENHCEVTFENRCLRPKEKDSELAARHGGGGVSGGGVSGGGVSGGGVSGDRRTDSRARTLVVNVKLMAKAVQQLKQIIIDKSTESWRSSMCPSSPSKKFKRKEDNSLLKFLALNALELTAPASDILLRSGGGGGGHTTGSVMAPCPPGGVVPDECPPAATPPPPSHPPGSPRWFQLSGHPDCFAPAGPGTIWKKCSGGGERDVYEALGREADLRDIVPRYLGEVEYNGQTFIELQDLLHGFRDPQVMDIKMGTRTFLECEVQNTSARTDLYQKMLAVDPQAPSSEEHELKAVTKLRYMQFREKQSSTSSQGFRIEAMKFRGAPPVTDLKTVRTPLDVNKTLAMFLGGRDEVRVKLLVRLKDMRRRLENSKYLQTHEIVGSSILIIYDECRAGAWLIDFAKTRALPSGCLVNHRASWAPGNHEEGFLYGLDQLIESLETIPRLGINNNTSSSSLSPSEPACCTAPPGSVSPP